VTEDLRGQIVGRFARLPKRLGGNGLHDVRNES
jgi:hypothetical protein